MIVVYIIIMAVLVYYVAWFILFLGSVLWLVLTDEFAWVDSMLEKAWRLPFDLIAKFFRIGLAALKSVDE